MTPPAKSSNALIIGAGIGGLSLAIGLAKKGHHVTVAERGSLREKTGAGIQLGANAVKRLRSLGVLDAIEPHAFRPEALWIFDALSGRRLNALPLGRSYEERYRAPYLSFHRADLHHGLLARAEEFEQLKIVPGFELAEISDTGSAVTANTKREDELSASYLIGADGLWSRTRHFVAPEAALSFTGQTAARSLLPRKGLPSPFDTPVISLWLAPKAHLVTYPVKAGSALNVVLVTEDGEAHQGWNEPADQKALLARIRDWAAAPKRLLHEAPAWRSWSLFSLQGLSRWSRGNVALLGDAAHPVLPFLAQGAALAIEDAMILAEALASCGRDHGFAFDDYARLRRPRAERLQRQSAKMGRIYHMTGPLRLARNLAIAMRRPEATLASLDWLYGA